MAATVNLRIDQGTTFSTDVTVWANTGDAFDLTGYTASAKMAQGTVALVLEQHLTCSF